MDHAVMLAVLARPMFVPRPGNEHGAAKNDSVTTKTQERGDKEAVHEAGNA